MLKITMSQARNLININEPFFLLVGNEIQEIRKENFLTTNNFGKDSFYPINRNTIKILIKQLFNIDSLKWSFYCNDKGSLLLNITDNVNKTRLMLKAI